jgi:hypothetical protein
MRTILALLIVASSAIAAAPQDEKMSHRDARPMVVTGCVDHSWLTVRQIDTSGKVVDRYRLRGNKDLMKSLTKDNNRHLVEVTGILMADPDETQGRGKTIQVGKNTTITTSGRDLPKPRGMKREPTVEVSSFRLVRTSCS